MLFIKKINLFHEAHPSTWSDPCLCSIVHSCLQMWTSQFTNPFPQIMQLDLFVICIPSFEGEVRQKEGQSNKTGFHLEVGNWSFSLLSRCRHGRKRFFFLIWSREKKLYKKVNLNYLESIIHVCNLFFYLLKLFKPWKVDSHKLLHFVM